MKVVNIYPKDVYLSLEISLKDIMKLRNAMNLVELKFDSNNPEELEAQKFFMEEFFPFIDETLRSINNAR